MEQKQQKSKNVLLINMGGTIYAEPYETASAPPANVKVLQDNNALMQQTLEHMVLSDEVDIFNWTGDLQQRFAKDSKEITAQDIKDLAQIIRNDNHEAIIITHGTDAMVTNAQMLAEELGKNDKKIAFVGAMEPLSMNRDDGDAALFLSNAINKITPNDKGDVVGTEPGVYVVGVQHGLNQIKFFQPDTVVKNRGASLENLTLTFDINSRL